MRLQQLLEQMTMLVLQIQCEFWMHNLNLPLFCGLVSLPNSNINANYISEYFNFYMQNGIVYSSKKIVVAKVMKNDQVRVL